MRLQSVSSPSFSSAPAPSVLDSSGIAMALALLPVTMIASYWSRLLAMPKAGSPLLRLQISKLKLNANRMSLLQRQEGNVVWLRER